jgi:hypothetical protein
VTPAGVVTTYAGSPTIPGDSTGALATSNTTQVVRVRAVGVNNTWYDTSSTTAAGWDTSGVIATGRTTAAIADLSGTLYGNQYSGFSGGIIFSYTPFLYGDVAGYSLSGYGGITSLATNGTNLYVAGVVSSTTDLAPFFTTASTVPFIWGDCNNTSNVLNYCASVGYGNGVWIAGGRGSNEGGGVYSASNLLRSTDGKNWTRQDIGFVDISCVTYGNGRWVVAGEKTTGTFYTATSTDNGVSWILGQQLSRFGALAYGNSRWAAGVLGSTPPAPLYYSTDGSSWTSASDPGGVSNIQTLFYSANLKRWYGYADSGSTILTANSNATSWTAAGTSLGVPIVAFTDVSGSITDISYGAQFYYPGGLAYNSNKTTLYVADAYNNKIRAISNNLVSTYAGSGVDASTGGPLLTAAVARPIGIALDPSGTLFVSSGERHDIRRIGDGLVSTYAGQYGTAGGTDGPPLKARFNGPGGVVVSKGDLYIGEVYNGDVRRITTFPEVRPGVPRVPVGGTIIATSNYPITINSRLDVSWSSIAGLISLFKFEPFSNNTVTANRCGGTTNDTLSYSTSSTELLGYLTGAGSTTVQFRGSNGATIAYPYTLNLTINALCNATTVVDSVSTSVTISAARIIYSPCNATLVFYRNEPISPVDFSLVTSDANTIYSATTLPTGLAFTRAGARTFTLAGTPTVQTSGSNYTILGQDTVGRIYSTVVSMVVNPERLILDVTGSLVQSNVTTTTAIDPITFTARFAPYGGYRSMRYTWSPPPPAGLDFLDASGRVINGSSYAVDTTYDASFTMTLAGTLTASQLRSFALANVSSYSINVTGTRTFPLPSLSPSLPRTITLRFGETLLFSSNTPSLFVGLDVSGFTYSAKTYFPQVMDTSIQDITVTDGYLPDGLAGQFVFARQQFEISGTPITAATYPFTLRARNGAGVTADLAVSSTVSTDSVTITALSDSCFNFIQYRNLSNAKTGFYPSNIEYSVRSTSGCNVTLTGANLPAGVSLVSNTGTYDLSGTPTTPTGSSLAILTARVPATGVDSSATFRYSVSAEAFFFSSNTFGLVQNVPMTPVQVNVTTLSENPVIRFSAPGIPPSLQITNTGQVRGTPEGSANGSFDVTAFTAYSSNSKSYAYTVSADRVVLLPSVYTTNTSPGCNVSIPITGYSLSALTVSNYRFQSPFLYGLTVNSTTGLLSGTLASSLPTSTTFTVLGSAGIVDGALTGTMTTANLTTHRAQMIEMRATSNLYIYYSDDKGLTWSDAYSQSNLLASRIGTNGSNVYLVPTSSSTVLRSMTGSSFTSVVVSNAVGYDPRFTAVVNKPGTSTWWIAGTLSNGSRSAYVFKSTNDGLTWPTATEVTTNGFTDREGNPASYTTSNAYLNGGMALAYKDGVLLLGGNQVLRSEDEGATWSAVSTGLIEVADFSVDQESVWLAVGSSLYPSLIDLPYMGDATTIVYSLDQGATWSPAVSPFVRNAYQLLYARGAWIVVGLTGTSLPYTIGISTSFDGINWTPIVFPPAGFAAATDVYPSGPLAPIGFDETDWKIGSVSGPTLYSHPYDTPLLSDWTSATMTGGSMSGVTSSSRFYSYVAQTIDPGPDSTTITFPLPTLGPVFISPAQSTYVVWQYMPIPVITFTATGTDPISYFVSSLPVGLTWDSSKHSVSGSSMRTGTHSFTVYAVDGANNVTTFTLTLICDIPRIVRQQTGAGAYTALVRDYTEVAAAINARDTRVNAPEPLGSFAAPYPPDVVTPSNCPCE